MSDIYLNKIKENFFALRKEIPKHVKIVGAVKSQTIDKVKTAIESGLNIIGHNYIQQAQQMKEDLKDYNISWHFIGHLQKNKINKAIKLFDMIETLDSLELAEKLNTALQNQGKVMPVLIEVNIAYEKQKSGVKPDELLDFVKQVSKLKQIKIQGLMTMGPVVEDIEDIRPYFMACRQLFIKIKKENIDNVEMKYLSMGMSDSYKIAIQEGANIIRIGTKLFGKRT